MSLPKQAVVISIIFVVIGVLALIAIIVLGALYGVERNKADNNQATTGIHRKILS